MYIVKVNVRFYFVQGGAKVASFLRYVLYCFVLFLNMFRHTGVCCVHLTMVVMDFVLVVLRVPCVLFSFGAFILKQNTCTIQFYRGMAFVCAQQS